MSTVQDHTIICGALAFTVDHADEVAPGLLVYRLPNAVQPHSPHRWCIGHHSGRAIANAMRHEAALQGAEFLGTLADWTQDPDALTATIDAAGLFAKLSYKDCIAPASEPFAGGVDVSNNGIYTEADVEQAAAEFKADGFDILVAMGATVPWMGLDTEPFNEAHDRIVRLAGAN